jgi:hypothetical protein
MRATGLKVVGGAAAVLLGLARVPVALGQSAEDLTVDLAECVDLAGAEERFACYEARVNAVIEERDGAAEGAASAAAGADVAGRQIPAPAGPESVDAAAISSQEVASESGEIVGTIAALRETAPDTYLITLDNGQIWRQVASKRYRLLTGMDVRIYSGWGNSLRLTAVGANGFIQVERIDAGAEQVASAGRANSGAAAANSTRSNDQAAGADESMEWI